MPHDFVRVEQTESVEHGTLWQADCDRCGWHTRQADARAWVLDVADLHRKSCPSSSLVEVATFISGVTEEARGTCLVMIPIDDGGIGCKAICIYNDARHKGPHRTGVSEPCPNCWALARHAEWCTDLDTNPRPLMLDFTADGTYWVALPHTETVDLAQ